MGNNSTAFAKTDIINQVSLDIVNKTVISSIKERDILTKNTQEITFENINCGGDFNIDRTKQVIDQTLEMDTESTTISKQELDTMLTEIVDVSAAMSLATESGFAASSLNQQETEQVTEVRNDLTADLKNSISVEDINSTIIRVANAQKVNFKGLDIKGDCNFGSVEQNISSAIIVSEISSMVTDQINKFLRENNIDMDTETKQDITAEGVDEAIDAMGEASAGFIDSIGNASSKLADSVGDAAFTAMLPFVLGGFFLMILIVVIIGAIIYMNTRPDPYMQANM